MLSDPNDKLFTKWGTRFGPSRPYLHMLVDMASWSKLVYHVYGAINPHERAMVVISHKFLQGSRLACHQQYSSKHSRTYIG